MNRRLATLVCILAFCGAAPAPRFSIEAMQRIAGVSGATISPDGTRVAYVVSRVNVEHNRYDDELEVYDRRTNTTSSLSTGHRSVSGAAWSPDGTSLAAVMDAGEIDQLYLVDPSSATQKQLTNGKTSVAQFVWSPRSDALAFTRREYAAPKTGAAAFEDALEVSDNAYLVTKAAVPVHLWSVDVKGQERRLTSGSWSVADTSISWSPDGASILFLRAPNGIYGVQDRVRVMRLAVGTGEIVPATLHDRYEDQALFSPDGARIAYLYARGGDPMNQPDAVIRSGGVDRDVTRALDRHVTTAAWMPDSRSLLLSVSDSAAAPLYVQPLQGNARRVPLGPVLQAEIQPQGSVARDGTIVFIGTQARHPAEVYVLAPAAASPQRITHLNDEIEQLDLGRAQRVTWRGPNGHLEDGVLTYPPDYRPGRKYPLVLRIHGGPTEASIISFEPFYQLAASHGYLVFAPNYRGSNDLGNAYEHAVYNDASIGPGKDVMAGIRAVQALGIVDTHRIGISGWSYGGLLTSWLEGHSNIWKAAVAGAAVNDLVVDYAIADDIDADAISFAGGSPYKGNSLGLWARHSPITYFKNIRTPTLILCNVYDVRVPIVESYEMYHALRDNGVPVKFYAYPSTGHLPNGPVRLADAYRKWLAWFDAYLHPENQP